jgi:hypothetical protein
MGIWPISMQRDIPNIHGHRRIFRSFEPFTSSEVIKVGAIASQDIKKNRVLFQKAMKPYLKRTKWIFHNKGFLPFFPYWLNRVSFIPFFKLISRFRRNSDTTLADWSEVFKREDLKIKEEQYLPALHEYCENLFKEGKKFKLIDNLNFNYFQKRNLLQLGYFLKTKFKSEL